MDIIDYNGEGRWSRSEILARYDRYAGDAGIKRRDLSPMEVDGPRGHWVYPVMDQVIAGIEAGDAACVRLGIEFVEEDARFPFGKVLKSNTARALRRASLTEEQKRRIRRRVFGLLRTGHVPREYREYAKLVRKIGFDASEIPQVNAANPHVLRFQTYFRMIARLAGNSQRA